MLDKASQSLHGPMWTYHSQYYWFVRSHWLRLSGDPNAGMAVDLPCEYSSLHQYLFVYTKTIGAFFCSHSSKHKLLLRHTDS